MTKELINFVIDELKNYKLNKAIFNSIILENNIEISAITISDIYYSKTNKFNSITENLALNNKLEQLEREIKRVENWLNILNEKELFIIKNFYIENKSYNIISHNWLIHYKYYYSIQSLKKLRKNSLFKICNVFEKSFFK